MWSTALKCALLAGVLMPLRGGGGQAELAEAAKEIIDLARVLPAEFATDAILALVESGRVRDERLKVDLLEEAFEMAGGARFPRKLAYHFGDADTREGLLGDAYELKLDAESLRCRAIRAMIRLRPRVARQLFEQIAAFQVPPHSCTSALTYDPREVFDTLAAVVSEGFDASERDEGLPLDFAERYVGAISSPVQVPPAARLIVKLGFAGDDFDRLVTTYVAALRRMAPDDRAFCDGRDLIDALDSLVEVCYKSKVPVAPLAEAARHYILGNLQGVRCADSVRRAARLAQQAEGQEAVVAQYNRSKARKAPYVFREVPAIRPEEARAAKLGPGPENPEYWTTQKGATLGASLQRLRFGPPHPDRGRPTVLPLEVRKSPEWLGEMSAVLASVEAWKPETGEDEVDFFLQKAVAYQPLIELAPDGPARDTALGRFVHFLARSPAQHTQPVLWYVRAAQLLNRLRRSGASAAGAEERPQRDVEWALREFERSGSLILTLRAKVHAILPKQNP